MPTEVIYPARGVGATPEEGAGLEMELDIMRINIFKDSDDENIERRVPPTDDNASAIGSANVRRPKHSH